APVVFKRELESLEAVEGDRAVLTCETSSAEGRVTWRKGSLLLTDGHKYSLERQGSTCVLVVSMLRAEDSGQYTCDTGDSQTTATLTVKECVRVTRELCDITVTTGQDAVFEVELSHPGVTDGEWWLADNQLQNNDLNEMTSQGRVHRLALKMVSRTERARRVAQGRRGPPARRQVRDEAGRVRPPSSSSGIWRAEDGGYYTCDAGEQLTTASLAVQVKEAYIVSGLTSTDVFVGEWATFSCQLSGRAAGAVQWWLDGTQLDHSPLTEMGLGPGAYVHTLTLKNLAPDDSGTVTFSAGSLVSTAKLLVKDPIVEVVCAMEDQWVAEGQPARFICQYSRPVEAQWKKDGRPVLPGGCRVLVEQDWNVARLCISSVSTEDRGSYSCEAEGTRVVASLHVEAKPIDIVQGLEDLDTIDGGEALFECALSRPESKDCRWLLNGTPVKESPNAEIVSFESGRRHLLLLKELHMADSCTVTFQAGTASSSAQLNVKSWQLDVVKGLEDKVAAVGEKVEFCVELTEPVPAAEVAWYANGVELKADSSWAMRADGRAYRLVLRQAPLMSPQEITFAARDAISMAKLAIIRPEVLSKTQTSVALSWFTPLHDGGSPILGYRLEMRVADSALWLPCHAEPLCNTEFVGGQPDPGRWLQVPSGRHQPSGHRGARSAAADGAARGPVAVTQPLACADLCSGKTARVDCQLSAEGVSVTWLRGSRELEGGLSTSSAARAGSTRC
ncbi:hypothetical protein CRUP_020923, partial [Coryphaenoides rupestris]